MITPVNVLSNDLTVLAGTLYGEIRGGTQAQQENIAQVILNRQHHHKFGTTIKDICLAPYQFSCWNANDPNRKAIFAAPTDAHDVWEKMIAVATTALKGHNPNRVKDAVNYYAKTLTSVPFWARPPAMLTFDDGLHLFFSQPHS